MLVMFKLWHLCSEILQPNGDISAWDMSSVENMASMFEMP